MPLHIMEEEIYDDVIETKLSALYFLVLKLYVNPLVKYGQTRVLSFIYRYFWIYKKCY